MNVLTTHPAVQQPLVAYGNNVKVTDQNGTEIWYVQISKDPTQPQFVRMDELLVEICKSQFENLDFARVLTATNSRGKHCWEYLEGYFHMDMDVFGEGRWERFLERYSK